NINKGKGIQATLEVEDSHVILTLVNPDGQQQSSSVFDKLREEAQKENDEFLKTIDENMQKIIKEQVKTSYDVADDLSEMELKKTLIEKMEGNKNLYKAVVEAYESDKIILDTYGEIVTLKRRRDGDANKDEEPSAGPDRGSKRRREGKEPESASAPTETATRSAGSDGTLNNVRTALDDRLKGIQMQYQP
nr:hypothetical protein [Tanacetum cinerariifolium]